MKWSRRIGLQIPQQLLQQNTSAGCYFSDRICVAVYNNCDALFLHFGTSSCSLGGFRLLFLQGMMWLVIIDDMHSSYLPHSAGCSRLWTVYCMNTAEKSLSTYNVFAQTETECLNTARKPRGLTKAAFTVHRGYTGQLRYRHERAICRLCITFRLLNGFKSTTWKLLILGATDLPGRCTWPCFIPSLQKS